MQQKLRDYIDGLFKEAPRTKKAVEVKEEILQNLLDKYEDMIANGKSEEAAYNIAIASIGDISELLKELKGMPHLSEEELQSMQSEKQRSALITSIAIMLYILCVVPVILFHNTVGLLLLFLMVAVATGLLIYNHMTKPQRVQNDDTIAEEFKEWRESSSDKRRLLKSIQSALWAIVVVVYVIVSFTTYAFHITWVIFIIGAAASNIIKALFDLKN